MGVTKAYLILYNLVCLGLWSTTFIKGVQEDSTEIWSATSAPLTIAQVGMILEVFHAALGLVRSPVVTTWIQVQSRLWILFAALSCEGAQTQKYAGVMILSWSLVEVIRYSFYLAALLVGKVPYPLFWLRYSAFYILYPTGITGELGTAFALFSSGCTWPKWIVSIINVILVLYIPGSPFMYLNMVGNRKSAMKKRFAPPPKAPRGCTFPVTDKETRSTTVTNKRAISAALEVLGDDGIAAASKCSKDKNYRFGYVKHFRSLVRLSAKSGDGCLASSEAGLAWLRENFEYIDSQGTVLKLKDVSSAKVAKVFRSGKIFPAEKKQIPAYQVPYDGGWHPTKPHPPKASLTGEDLKKQCSKWVEEGVIEQDAAAGISWTSDYFNGGGDLRNVHVVLIGAGSAMGPAAKLFEHGANVVALDIPGVWGKGGKRPASKMWDRLFSLAKAAPSGSLTYPCFGDAEPSEAAGADLMTETKEIGDWLCDVWLPSVPVGAKICIGNYTYLDGDLHVKLSLCADLLIERVLDAAKARGNLSTIGCAFLCTPTDAHLVSRPVFQSILKNLADRKFRFFESLIRFATGFLQPNICDPILIAKDEGDPDQAHLYMVDGLSVAQGPNYALAKRLQHWRACLAFSKGFTVSSMVAPSTATLSVIHNKTFAWAYGGMPEFGFEIFKQDTTNAVMAALLLHDILNPKSPKTPPQTFKSSTLELFTSQSVHGGLWRSPYTVNSIGEVSALLYFVDLVKPAFLPTFLVLSAGLLITLAVTMP